MFDGIGGFPLAATIVGVTPLWASEIEPVCIAITRARFPNMEHLGSITDISGADIPPVDIIAFGSPCQNLSVAGNRMGLRGAQSGLFHEAIRIIYEMREKTNGKYPTFIIWENVPGAFGSNKGRDFRAVLEEITKVDIPMPASGRWAHAGVVRGREICAAWRQLDAQYWGVPQRRKRIFLVGSFGSDSAEEILFERESVRRYLVPSGTTREGTAADTQRGVILGYECSDTKGSGNNNVTQPFTYAACYGFPLGFRAENTRTYDEKATTLCNGTRPGFCNGTIYAVSRTSLGRSVAAANKYIEWIIRRLTPLECERLQGYPDYWTVLPKLEDMTDEEFRFYSRIFCFDKEIRGVHIKSPPTRESIIKWYNKLDGDGSRYKALGNSVAVPCALRMIEGIVNYTAN